MKTSIYTFSPGILTFFCGIGRLNTLEEHEASPQQQWGAKTGATLTNSLGAQQGSLQQCNPMAMPVPDLKAVLES